MKKIIRNYHTHTKRCGHAYGEDEEYVLEAIKYGIKELGFSDHVPFKSYSFPNVRFNYDRLDEYVQSITSLKEKYKDEIEIHIGLEAEYIEEFLDDYKDYMENHHIEYLICGQHCTIENGNLFIYNQYIHDEKVLVKYADAVIAAIKSGMFKYICHPDIFMTGYRHWDDAAIRESKRIIEAATKYDIPLEINCNGIRYHQEKLKRYGQKGAYENYYPFPDFWKLVSEYGAKAIIGVDAHFPEAFLDEKAEKALEFAKEYKVNIIDKLDFSSQEK